MLKTCVLALCTGALLQADPTPKIERDPEALGVPFQRYYTQDSFGRRVTFYLSIAPSDAAAERRPVALIILGSGCQSVFQKHGNQVGGGLQMLLRQEAKGRVRVLVGEKPGVKYLDEAKRPGTAEGASEEFLAEHTLPRWAEANGAALRAVWTLPDIDRARTLVMGHSEGGRVAARVAAELPAVTHVASLAGGGPTQLFDLLHQMRQPRPGDGPDAGEQRVAKVLAEWKNILADPDSTTKFWLAHPYRRWSSFLKTGTTDELLRSKARVYLAHGTEDTASHVVTFDVARAELLARGRDVTAERIAGGDHGFRPKDAPPGPPKEMQALFGRVLTWFLAEAPAPGPTSGVAR
jgi:dienelactone hydrolase